MDVFLLSKIKINKDKKPVVISTIGFLVSIFYL